MSNQTEKAKVDGSCIKSINEHDLVDELGVSSRIVCKKFMSWITFGLTQFDNTFNQPEPATSSSSSPSLENTQLISDTVAERRSLHEQNNLAKSTQKRQFKDVLVIKRVQGNEHAYHKFKESDCRIGKNPNCQIHIDGESIDPFHIQVCYRAGGYFLKNLSARDYTYVKINSRTPLSHNMRVQMGSHVFAFFISRDLSLDVEVVHGVSAGQMFSFSASPNTRLLIGRKASNQIPFPKDNTISSLHARISFLEASKQWYIEDLMTTNGSWMQVQHEIRITSGMTFKPGESNFHFECQISRVRDTQQVQETFVLAEDRKLNCMSCQKPEQNIFFTPCNHCVICEDCVPKVDICPLCEVRVVKSTKIYRI